MHTFVALILVETAFFAESLNYFLCKRQAMNQSTPQPNLFTHTHTLLCAASFKHPLYSNYTCANKLHWNNEKLPEKIFLFGSRKHTHTKISIWCQRRCWPLVSWYKKGLRRKLNAHQHHHSPLHTRTPFGLYCDVIICCSCHEWALFNTLQCTAHYRHRHHHHHQHGLYLFYR